MEELDIQIDSDIPLPDDTRSRNRYPFGKMNVGDSIFIPMEPEDNVTRMKNRLSQACRTFGQKQDPEWKFILRQRLEQVKGSEVSGVRIWRKS